MGMESFYTRRKANEGIKVPLSLPGGAETEDYLIIRGIDSDAFRDADTLARSQALLIVEIENKAERVSLMKESRLDILTSLIASWSFEEECTPETVRTMLIEAPQIADAVDRVAAKRASFFGKGLSN